MKKILTILALLCSCEKAMAQQKVNKSCDVISNGTIVDSKIIVKTDSLYSVNPVFVKTKNLNGTTASYIVMISVTKGSLVVQVADRNQIESVGNYSVAKVIAAASMEFDKIVDNEILGAGANLGGLQVRCYGPQ